MDVAAYLKRIRFDGPLDPGAETLRRLQLAHLFSVPFENLSIHWKEPIVLDDEALFDKIVQRKRGGFCYELNGLFSALLRELGYDVKRLSAGVRRSDGEFGPDFSHMALLVNLARPWLVDVGFGDCFLEPLLLDERGEQPQFGEAYRIDEAGDGRLILMRREAGADWAAQYRFSLQPREYTEYAEMCRYHQTSPESHFTQRRVCSLATEEGRVTLSHMSLITTRRGLREERELADEQEWWGVLRERFGILKS